MTDIVQKLWGFCHNLRHDGIGYTEYVEQLFIDSANKTSAKFQTTIPHSTVIPQACDQGKTVFQIAPKHRVTEAYRAVADEIEQRLSALAPRAMEAAANA